MDHKKCFYGSASCFKQTALVDSQIQGIILPFYYTETSDLNSNIFCCIKGDKDRHWYEYLYVKDNLAPKPNVAKDETQRKTLTF